MDRTVNKKPQAGSVAGRHLFLFLGWLFFALGLLGVLLPLLPTTPFMLLALWAFSRSSDRLHDWLYSHPRFGPPLRDWRRHGVVSRRAKVVGVSMMSISGVWLVGFSSIPVHAVVIVCLTMVTTSLYLLTRPSRVPLTGESSRTEGS